MGRPGHLAPDERPLAWSSGGAPARPPAGAKGAAAKGAPAPVGGRVRVRLERQGRGGKVVSVVEGLPGHPDRLAELARLLKARCGAGGALKGRLVEIQGDHRDRLVALLLEQGLEAVRAGG